MLSPVMVIGTFTGDDIKRLDDVARLVVNCGTGQNATADEAMEINIREERMILLVLMINIVDISVRCCINLWQLFSFIMLLTSGKKDMKDTILWYP